MAEGRCIWWARRRLVVVVVATAVLGAACGGGDGDAVNNDAVSAGTETPAVSADPSQLECEVQGYPCTLADVPAEILERSAGLRAEAVDLLTAGETMAEVAMWLEEQPGIVEIGADDTAVRFRLEGGRGNWVLGNGALGTRSAPGGGSDNPTQASAASAALPLPVANVVNPGEAAKRALVLSPVAYDFGATDDGARVAQILGETRGYEGGVDLRVNSTPTDSNVGVGSFIGWDGYDVIHVATHGKRLCDPAPCRAVIVASTLASALPDGTTIQDLDIAQVPGLGQLRSEVSGTEYLILTADFFRAQYPQGLQDSIVYLSACQTLGEEATDLAVALRGSTSAFLGWSETVDSGDAFDAAEALYTDLSENGYTVTHGHERLGDLTTGATAPVADGEPAAPVPELVLAGRSDGDDLRLREVVTALHPVSSQMLDAGSVVSIIGEAGDDEPDSAPYLVRVEGIDAEDSDDAIVHIEIDGVAAQPQPASSGQGGEDGEWLVSGQVDLPYDISDERQVNVRAWVELPDGGQSQHEVTARLGGQQPLMGYEWQLEATHVTSWTGASFATTPYTATAVLTLEFEAGQALDEPFPRYVVTGGTVNYSYSHEYGGCSYSASDFAFDVDENIAGPSVLTFDTTTTPVTYDAFIWTGNQEFGYSSVCRGTTASGDRVATNVWAKVGRNERLEVSAEGTTIAGVHLDGEDFDSGESFIQQSDYVITRSR